MKTEPASGESPLRGAGAPRRRHAGAAGATHSESWWRGAVDAQVHRTRHQQIVRGGTERDLAAREPCAERLGSENHRHAVVERAYGAVRRRNGPRKLVDRGLPGDLHARPCRTGNPDAGARYRVYEADRDIDGSGADVGDLFRRERTVERLGTITRSAKIPQPSGTVRVESYPRAVAEGIAPDRELMQPADHVAAHTCAGTRSLLSNASPNLEVSEANVSVRDLSRFVRHFGNAACASPKFAYSQVAVRAKQAVARVSSRNSNAATVRPSSSRKAGVAPWVGHSTGSLFLSTRSGGIGSFRDPDGLVRSGQAATVRFRHRSCRGSERRSRPGMNAPREHVRRREPSLRRRSGNYESARRHSRPVGLLGLVRSAGCTGWHVLFRKTLPTTGIRLLRPVPQVEHDQSSSLELRGIGGNIGPRVWRVRS